MTRSQLAIALERAIDSVHHVARDLGHDPGPWLELDEGVAAHTACRRCGRTAAVRVYADRAWKAGLSTACIARETSPSRSR